MNKTGIDRGLLLLRVALGIVFVMHGWQKISVLGLGGVAGFLGQLGVPFPGLSAAIVTATELVGGLALLLGSFTRIAAALIAFDMLVAVATVHLANGFFLPNGYEFALTLLLASGGLVMSGAGAYSVDALLQRDTTTAPRQLSRAA